MKQIKEHFSNKKGKMIAVVSMACLMMSMACVTAFADEATAFPITTAMIEPVKTNMLAAVDVAAPVGLSIMGVMLGIRLVPKLLKRLSKG